MLVTTARPPQEDSRLGADSPISIHRLIDRSSDRHGGYDTDRRVGIDSRGRSAPTSLIGWNRIQSRIVYYARQTGGPVRWQTATIRRRIDRRQLAGLYQVHTPRDVTSPLEVMSRVRTVSSFYGSQPRRLFLRFPHLGLVASCFDIVSDHDVIRRVASYSVQRRWGITRRRGDLTLRVASIGRGEPRPGVAAAAGEQQARERDQQHQDEEERDEGVGVHHLRDLRSVRHHDHILSHEEPGVKHNFSTAELS